MDTRCEEEDNERISVHEAGILRRVCVEYGKCFSDFFLQLDCCRVVCFASIVSSGVAQAISRL
jgi:hypothetical protein